MNIGYIKSTYILNNDIAYRKKLEQLNVVKIYADKYGESVALRDMLGYARQGDNIIVEDIRHLGKSIGEFIELALYLKQQGITIICKQQQLDTSFMVWDRLFESLKIFIEEPIVSVQGRGPRNIEDLDECFELVSQGTLTVEEACRQLNIGKSTYYRRWRKIIKANQEPPEKHPERFKEFESLVAEGKISVTEAAKQMNIGITTYYRMRKAQIEKKG